MKKKKNKIQIYLPKVGKGNRTTKKNHQILTTLPRGEQTTTGHPTFIERFNVNSPLTDLSKLK